MAKFSAPHTMAPHNLVSFWKPLIICAISMSTLLPCLADGFPGKGSESAWSDALPHYNLANKYLNTERYEQAIEQYTAAIQLYPFDPDFYTNLGVAYRKIDDLRDAEQVYKKATELSPDDWMPWSDLANVYLKQNKFKETIATFERTLKCKPPADERTAIEHDIADIRKFMSMQGNPQGAELTVGEPGKQPKMTTGAPTSHVMSQEVLTAPPAKRGATAGRTGAKPVAHTSSDTTRQSDSKSLKDSGWDYVNK